MSLQLEFELPHWLYWGALLFFPLAYMAADRWWSARASRAAAQAAEHVPTSDELAATHEDPTETAPGNRVTRWFDGLSNFSGFFVAYWTVIAVVVYFFEVVARYFFNSPTNWAHESMYLMFGMQYILAGAYAYNHDAHVRVDLFYAKASARNKAALDIITSFAFLIFVLAFIWTGWTFFSSSMNQNEFFFASGYANEVSFSEWGVAYYPVKATLVIGGVLLLLQGISRFIKDVQVYKTAGQGRESHV